jgi:hypothetical protein
MNSETSTAHLPHFCGNTCMLEAEQVGYFTGDDWVNTEEEFTHENPHCDWCGESDDDGERDDDDAWADHQTLISCGHGDDEDYGYYGDDY